MLGYEFLEDWLDLGQVVSFALKMRMRAGERRRHRALRGSDIDERLIRTGSLDSAAHPIWARTRTAAATRASPGSRPDAKQVMAIRSWRAAASW
jgi:hypothetical protein